MDGAGGRYAQFAESLGADAVQVAPPTASDDAYVKHLETVARSVRIALVSTPFVPVPPRGYGGTELVVAELALGLRSRGAEVVVYATGDSRLQETEVRSYFPQARWPPDAAVDATHAAWCLRDIARDPGGFDAVHLHSCAAVELSRLCPYTLIATLPVGHNPYGIAANPLTNAVYLADEAAATMTILDGRTNTVTATLPVGQVPVGVATDPLTATVYIANEAGNSVSVIRDRRTCRPD